MRRKDREVTNLEVIGEIIAGCKVCSVAMQDKLGLYILPMNFGYSYKENKLTLFFHSAKEGRKLDAIRKDGKVAFEMNCNNKLIEAKAPCGYGSYFSSITGTGFATIVEDVEEKKQALTDILLHQAGKEFIFEDKHTNSVCIFKIEVDSFCAKSHRE